MDIRKYLFENRITITEFAKMLGYSIGHICAIKNGKLKPNVRLAKAIIQASNGQITMEELIPGVKNEV